MRVLRRKRNRLYPGRALKVKFAKGNFNCRENHTIERVVGGNVDKMRNIERFMGVKFDGPISGVVTRWSAWE